MIFCRIVISGRSGGSAVEAGGSLSGRKARVTGNAMIRHRNLSAFLDAYCCAKMRELGVPLVVPINQKSVITKFLPSVPVSSA
jgi:hypothetical protein